MASDLTALTHQYASRYFLMVGERLGSAIHGMVHVLRGYTFVGGTALKVHHSEEFYRRELMAYERLKQSRVRTVLGFSVPLLIRADDEFLALEMSIVERPYVLDFAGAYLDNEVPWFEDEVWETWAAEKREKFGARWREVQAVLGALEVYGIHLLDVNPGNIAFALD